MNERDRLFLVSLEKAAKSAGVSLDQSVLEACLAHYQLLERWNKRINLTRIIEPQEAAERHWGESFFLASKTDFQPGDRVADLGSGPGFPGLPIALLRPDIEVSLIEAVSKKAVFLQEASRGLPNVQVLAHRAEKIDVPFRWTLSRAVALDEILDFAVTRNSSAALLLGEDEAERAVHDSRFKWRRPEKLPWGERRVALVGGPSGTASLTRAVKTSNS